MWSVMVIILLPLCNACLSNHNQKVCFHSRNFHNILHWDPVDPTLFPGEKVTYSVQYKRYGEPLFEIKESCQNITALSCDLSEDTPSDHDVHYLARVLANGLPHGTTNHRFKPLKDTILGPPILATYTTVSSLHVDVTLPFGPNGVSVAEIIDKSKILPYSTVIHYTLTITHPAWAAQVRESTTGQFNIDLKNKTKYCGYVVYKPSSELGRPQSENASFCDTLKDEPLRPLPWLLTSAALLLAIVIMAGLCVCSYVKGGKDKSMPPQLVTVFTTPPRILESPDGNLVISKPEMWTKTDQTVYAKIQMKPNVPSVGVGGYSPQDILCQPWQDSSGSSVGTGAHSPAPNAADSSGQSSENYGMVAVHVPAQVNNFQEFTTEDRASSKTQASPNGETWDKGGLSPKMASHRVPPLPVPDSCDNSQPTLLLPTMRDSNGQLMFNFFNFQTQSGTGATERKPLLSDVTDSKQEGPTLASFMSFDGSECSDSGCDDSSVNTPIQQYCNTHYFPSQPVVTDLHSGCQNKSSPSDTSFESGYKQNWMPEIRHEYRPTNYPWSWTGDKKEDEEEEEEDRGGEEESRQIILGNWMVQLQD